MNLELQPEKIKGVYDIVMPTPDISSAELIAITFASMVSISLVLVFIYRMFFTQKKKSIRLIKNSLHYFTQDQLSHKQLAAHLTHQLQIVTGLAYIDKGSILPDVLVNKKSEWTQFCGELARIKYTQSSINLEIKKTELEKLAKQAVKWIRLWK